MPINEISDRTNRLVRIFHSTLKEDSLKAFSKFTVALGGSKEVLSNYNGQVMAIAVANEVARFHPFLQIMVPPGIKNLVSVPFGSDNDLLRCLENIRTSIQPNSDNRKTKLSEPVDVMISVGASESLPSKYEIVINSDGWHSFLCAEGNKSAPRLSKGSTNMNAIGALASASFASAEAFRRMLELMGADDRRIRKKYSDLSFSTLDFSINESLTIINPPLPNEIDLGPITLVGAGAVGNGLLLTLFVMQDRLTGQIDVVDYQNYATTDLNRCLMLEKSKVSEPKATSVACLFKATSCKIKVNDHVTRYESSQFHKDKLDLAISTVDENEPRLVIQSDLPRILLHGATGEQVATISRHDFLNEACLGCLFFEKGESLSTRISKETGLDVQRVEALLSDVLVSEDDIRKISEKTQVGVERLKSFEGRPFLELYAKEICGVITTQVGDEEIAASASFASAASGVFLAAELVKERAVELGQWKLNNRLSMSLFSPSKRWLHQRPKDERCPCFCSSSIMIEAYKEKWGI